MITRNKHLNIFNYYSEQSIGSEQLSNGKRTRPIENNLSRGLAIVMEDNPLFLSGLIDFLNHSAKGISIYKPNFKENIKIFIQGNIKSLTRDIVENELPVDKIFGATLTAGITEQDRKHLTVGDKTIPDICLHLTDKDGSGLMLLIEVKPRDENSVKSQVENQMAGLMQSINEKRNADDTKLEETDINFLTQITWEDIVRLLQSTLSLGGGK